MQETEDMPTAFRSIFAQNRIELKAKIEVTDALFHQLLTRHFLLQQNVDYIMVSS